MKPHGPRHGSSGTTDVAPDQFTAGSVDLVWPPSADDLARVGIVTRTGYDGGDGRLRVFVRLPDVLRAGEHQAATAPTQPAASTHPSVRARHWGVAQPTAAYPFHVDGDDPMAAASAGGELRGAAVALAAGLSLALLSYVQFRSARADSSALVTAVAEVATASMDGPGLAPVTETPQAVGDRIAPPERLARRLVARLSAIEATDAHMPAATTLAWLDAIDGVGTPEAATLPSLARPAASPEPAEVVADTSPLPSPAGVDERPADAVVVAHADSIAGAEDRIAGDEDRIRAALMQWRTAYSALDVRAAREVWPTVDARALERAFQALEWQDLRFDHCDLTVVGRRAQAACRVGVIYVPRVGRKAPRATPREWTFELEKLDQRWTIASARAS